MPRNIKSTPLLGRFNELEDRQSGEDKTARHPDAQH
jgi:hypothetical protein